MFRLKRFSAIFSLLLILSVFIGVVHELNHVQHHDGTCEACLFAHTPALIDVSHPIIPITAYYEPFLLAYMPLLTPVKITLRSRAPPLS